MSAPIRWFRKFGSVNAGASRLEAFRKDMRRDDEHGEGVISLAYDRQPPSITPRSFALLIAGFLAFKGALIADLGAEVYVSAIQTLDSGAMVERAAAFLMQPDFVSQAIAGHLTALLA